MKTFDREPSECSRPVKKPKQYAGPVRKAFIEIRGRKEGINVLLDSSSYIVLMNQDTARPLDIPTEARDSLLKITTFDHKTAPTGGRFYTHRILIELGVNCPRSMISCEILDAGKYDLLIPFALWHDKHLLKNIADPSKLVFELAKCYAHIADEAVADLFEWDETVAYDEVSQYVGRIRPEEEGGVLLHALPIPDWQYRELLEETPAEMLGPRRTFNHAINLKKGAEPLRRPIYPISVHEVDGLDKSIKKMLAQGKIVCSESPN